VIPVSTFVELLDNVPTRYRALLLLATFADLRFGGLAGLRRNQLDLDACEVRVTASTWETDDGRLTDGDPKSQAGKRTVAFPVDIVPELAGQLQRFADPEPNGLASSGRRAGGCAGRASARSGTRPGEWSACPVSASTTCGPPGTRWRPRKAPASGN
jgi:hypothetical protein